MIFTKQAIRFVLTGLLVTGLHVVIASTLIETVSLSPSLANGAAFVTATAFSYLINTTWSFSSPLHGKNLIRFFLVSVTGLFLAMTISGIAQDYGLDYRYGIAGVVCTIPPVTFLLHSFWTYK